MALAIFDLDNTLLCGDSDYLWGQYLCEQGIVDADQYESQNAAFYEQYKQGVLDIYEFLSFSLKPLAENRPADLYRWRAAFIKDKIEPIILEAGRNLLEQHRSQGHTLLIITATNRFVTEPIATALGVDHLLATEPEMLDEQFTGRVAGIPCFQDGKVQRLEQWLNEYQYDLEQSWFYSDSHNDLPLLEKVTFPAAVDPDPTLLDVAQQRHWPILSLRNKTPCASHYSLHR